MVIKEGYKQTEIGVIPMDWEVKSYDEVFYFLNTATYSRAELTELDEIKYIHYGDIHTKFHFHLDVNNSYLPSIPQSKLKNYSLLKDGDIIMADASEDYLGIGKSIEIKNLGDNKVISGLHTFLFRDKNNYFINGYKGYIHSINVVKKQFDSLATGMKVYGVSKNNLKKILIPIPTLKEQTAIATALSDADGLITGLEKLIAKKRNIKQGAMQQLLQPAAGWEVKKLGDLITYKNGKSYENDVSIDGDYYLITLNSISIRGKLKNDHLRIKSFDNSLEKGDLIIVLSDVAHGNFLGLTDIIPENNKYVLNQRMGALKNLNGVTSEYLSYYINENQLYFKMSGKGSSQQNLGKDDILNFEINLPNIQEQTKIATILSDMDAELSALEQKLEKYKKVKLGMMQELLTGKTRLV
jgi:type I restriction enzyme S subunit